MNLISTGILAASIMVSFPLNTQAECNCLDPGEEPYMPCGYCEDAYEIEYSRIEIESYLGAIQAYTQCLGECINDINSNAENIINDWNSAVHQYTNR
jgi:hypothetical protein